MKDYRRHTSHGEHTCAVIDKIVFVVSVHFFLDHPVTDMKYLAISERIAFSTVVNHLIEGDGVAPSSGSKQESWIPFSVLGYLRCTIKLSEIIQFYAILPHVDGL